VPDSVSLVLLCDITRLVDKYDLATLLKHPASAWIEFLLPSASTAACEALFVIAFLLRNDKALKTIGERILLKSTAAVTGSGSKDVAVESYDFATIFGMLNWPFLVHHPLTLILLARIDSIRTKSLMSIGSEIEGILDFERSVRATLGSNCLPGCIYAEKRLQFVTDELASHSLWPVLSLFNRPLEGTLYALKHFDFERMDRLDGGNAMPKCRQEHCTYNSSDSFETIAKWLKEEAEDIEKSIASVCYKCFRDGNASREVCDHE